VSQNGKLEGAVVLGQYLKYEDCWGKRGTPAGAILMLLSGYGCLFLKSFKSGLAVPLSALSVSIFRLK
jgi:hypothetical protein